MNAAVTFPAPRVTAAMLEAATYHQTAVVVQDADGVVFTLDRLTAAQADDETLTVLIEHPAAMDYVACAGGRLTAAARAATTALRMQHARGLL